MTCREFAGFMAEYLSGELPAGTLAQFEHHLTVCPNCVTYLSNYRTAVALGRTAFSDEDGPLPADVPDDLVKAILSVRTR